MIRRLPDPSTPASRRRTILFGTDSESLESQQGRRPAIFFNAPVSNRLWSGHA